VGEVVEIKVKNNISNEKDIPLLLDGRDKSSFGDIKIRPTILHNSTSPLSNRIGFCIHGHELGVALETDR
jgi:hypothetical protein